MQRRRQFSLAIAALVAGTVIVQATGVANAAERDPGAKPSAVPSASISVGDGTRLTPAKVVAALDAAGSKVLDTAAVAATRPPSISHADTVDVRIPRDPSSAVVLGTREAATTLGVGVPASDASSRAVIRDGVSVYTNDRDQTATAVNPLTDGGVQLLVTIGSPTSPTRYDFPVTLPPRAHLRLTDDGGAQVTLGDGRLAAMIPAPWAVDARQRRVPTHFEVHGTSLVQVVDHTSVDVAYPVVADPKIFMCDWYTHKCVKFTKSETKWIAANTGKLSGGGLAGAGAVCYKMGFAAGTACTIIVGAVGGALADSFNSAAAKGKCVELHFLVGPPPLGISGLTHWKTEGC